MAKELTGCGKFLVWVLTPVAAGLVGYFFVGPNIGGIGLGQHVPVIRSLGQELANKVKGNSKPTKTPKRGTKPTPPPTSDGATEFQRIRESGRDAEERRSRRAPVDVID